MIFQAIPQSPLVKVYPDEAPSQAPYVSFSALPGETASFQIAYHGDMAVRTEGRVRVSSALASFIRIRAVELSPSAYPCHSETDDGYQRIAPGMFPDCLRDLKNESIWLVPGQWRALWVNVDIPPDMKPGSYEIILSFDQPGQNSFSGSCTLNLTVLGSALPRQKLIHTEWFHGDCLADFYGVPALSEAWWGIVADFIETAARRGINMILTPAFTPPLDTAVGMERTTVQLVEISKEGDCYSFRFDALKRWIDLCLSKGIEYFEIAHLFTQWGAKAAPKIIAWEDGVQRRIFGWDTPATGEAYTNFLRQYLPQLKDKLAEWGVLESTYFHISDEPGIDQLESYLAAKQIVAPLLEGCRIIDALSDYSFYEKGVVEHPVPSNDLILPFLEHIVPNLWTYYCTAQHLKVSNRFFSMPSLRNRILGVQLYKFGLQGFLHWGYNFYNSAYSREHINPFAVTDAHNCFPSGDAFLVYPNPDGTPGESIRLMVLFHAMQDIRAFELLESLAGRDFVLTMLDEGLDTPITFEEYPKEDSWLLNLRERVNREIAKRI
jgi:hypothetical protein